MHCPHCQTENPDQANFCLKCGTKLQAICPQCDTALPVDAMFCFKCGRRVAPPAAEAPSPPPPPPPALPADTVLTDALQRLVPKEFAKRLLATRGKVSGERRMVTILFSDVKGSTAMAEQLDPEDVMDVMNGAFEVLIPPVYRHEGTIARLMGDAILAFFGAPLSHEDDAVRAIRAGLEIVTGAEEYAARLARERGIPGFNVRVGINTGLVVVGEVGTDLRVEYTAMGDAINLAARLEQNAPAGGILISHDTYQLVRGLFEVQALEPIAVKGKEELVRVYVVQGARPRAFRMATRGVEGVETRMVGREGELKRLQDAFYLALEDSECQVATVVGEAGVGKTRLLSEFENWLAEEVLSPLRYFRGRASPEMQGTPYSLLRDLFAIRFDIRDSDPAPLARDKLEAGVGRALGGGEQGQMKAHLIGQLLGFDFSASPSMEEIGDDARQLYDRAIIYLAEFFRAASTLATLVVLLEDIHWADDSSLDALGQLVPTLSNRPLSIVCLARPALFDRRPHWGEGQAFHTRIDLQPLSRRDSRRLVGEILQKMVPVPQVLRDLVVAGAEGNPLYVEELIKVLIEQQVIIKSSDEQGRAGLGPWAVDETQLTDLRVPPTLTGVLQARLDGLPLEQRTILQQAAVVGYTFWDLAVIHISERSSEERGDQQVPGALSILRSRELVARHETSTIAGSQEFVFKHAALREVAYKSILKKVRRGYHSLVADWLIEQGGERAGEHAGLIAEHLELAGRAEEALGYLKQAGKQAAAQYANAAAADYVTRALALLDDLGWAPGRVAKEQYGLLLRREAVYDLLAWREEQGADLAALADLAASDGLTTPADPAAPAALIAGPGELTEEQPRARARRAEVARRQSWYHQSLGEFAAALASGEEAVRWAEQTEDPAGVAQGLIRCGAALWHQGLLDQAREPLERALALARKHGDRAAEVESLHMLGNVAIDQRDFQGAVDVLDQALHIRRELVDRRGEARSLNSLAIAFNYLGDLAGARRQFERVLVLCQEIGDRCSEAFALGSLAITYEYVGVPAKARRLYEQSLALARLVGDRFLEASTLYNLSCNSLNLGDPATARLQSEQTLALCHETGDRWEEGYGLTGLGFALAELGELDAATAAFEQALVVRRELGQEAEAIDDLIGMAVVAARQGRSDVALAHAREVLAWMAAHGTEGVEFPVRDTVIAADVLAACRQPEEAATALVAARALVREQAGRISDPEMRASFAAMPLHARLLRQES